MFKGIVIIIIIIIIIIMYTSAAGVWRSEDSHPKISLTDRKEMEIL